MVWLLFFLFSGQSGDIELSFISHEDLYQPNFLRLDRQGRIYTNNSDQNIFVFGPDGAFIRKFGRKGQGPGEFTRMEDIGFLSDGRILVSDGATDQILLLDDQGAFIKAMPIKASSIDAFLVLPDDTFVLSTSNASSFTIENRTEPEPRYLHFTVDGRKLGEYGVKIRHENPMAAVFANSGFLVQSGKDLVHAGITSNELTFYRGDEERKAHYALTFVPIEVEAKMVESTGSDGNKRISMFIKADTLCHGLAAEPDGGLLMLRATSSSEGRDPDAQGLYQLIRLNATGEVLKTWDGAWEARNLALDPSGKVVYFVNELQEETAISRLIL